MFNEVLKWIFLKWLEVFVRKHRIIYSIVDSIYRVKEQLVRFILINENYIILMLKLKKLFRR